MTGGDSDDDWTELDTSLMPGILSNHYDAEPPLPAHRQRANPERVSNTPPHEGASPPLRRQVIVLDDEDDSFDGISFDTQPLQRRVDELEAQLSAVMKDRDEALTQANGLRVELERHVSHEAQLREERDKAVMQIESLSAADVESKRENAIKQAGGETLAEENTQLRQKLLAETSSSERLGEQLEAFQRMNKNLEAKLIQHQKEFEAYRTRVNSDFKEQFDALIRANEQLRAALASEKEKTGKQKRELFQAQDELEENRAIMRVLEQDHLPTNITRPHGGEREHGGLDPSALAELVCCVERAGRCVQRVAPEIVPQNQGGAQEAAAASPAAAVDEARGAVVHQAAEAVDSLIRLVKRLQGTRIAVDNLSPGDVAMFFPIPKKQASDEKNYMAFTVSCSKLKCFLSDESKLLIGQTAHFREAYVLGRIVQVEEYEATPRDEALGLGRKGSRVSRATVEALNLP